jgi:phytoene/squalene synthetase
MPPSAERAGSAREFASLYAPPPQRALLASLWALEAEIGATARPGLDHGVAHVRLEWWREECARARAGTAVHPLTRALYAQLAASGVRDADLTGLIEVTRWDLAAAPFATRAELVAYCERWASALTEPVAKVALPESAFGRRLGAALRELEFLVELSPDARLGRLRVPLDELAAIGVDPASLAEPPWNAALAGLLSARHSRLRTELSACVALASPARQPPLRGLLVWAALAQRQSLQAARARPGAWRASGPSRLADAWAGWRAARHAERGRLVLHAENPD